MLSIASTLAASTPGQTGKGAAPGGGDLFALSMQMLGGAADAGEIAVAADPARQAVAAPGTPMPTAAAPSIAADAEHANAAAVPLDPALAWLPAVNIAVPAPLDIPPALAASSPAPATVAKASVTPAADPTTSPRARPLQPTLRTGTAVTALAAGPAPVNADVAPLASAADAFVAGEQAAAPSLPRPAAAARPGGPTRDAAPALAAPELTYPSNTAPQPIDTVAPAPTNPDDLDRPVIRDAAAPALPTASQDEAPVSMPTPVPAFARPDALPVADVATPPTSSAPAGRQQVAGSTTPTQQRTPAVPVDRPAGDGSRTTKAQRSATPTIDVVPDRPAPSTVPMPSAPLDTSRPTAFADVTVPARTMPVTTTVPPASTDAPHPERGVRGATSRPSTPAPTPHPTAVVADILPPAVPVAATSIAAAPSTSVTAYAHTADKSAAETSPDAEDPRPIATPSQIATDRPATVVAPPPSIPIPAANDTPAPTAEAEPTSSPQPDAPQRHTEAPPRRPAGVLAQRSTVESPRTRQLFADNTPPRSVSTDDALPTLADDHSATDASGQTGRSVLMATGPAPQASTVVADVTVPSTGDPEPNAKRQAGPTADRDSPRPEVRGRAAPRPNVPSTPAAGEPTDDVASDRDTTPDAVAITRTPAPSPAVIPLAIVPTPVEPAPVRGGDTAMPQNGGTDRIATPRDPRAGDLPFPDRVAAPDARREPVSIPSRQKAAPADAGVVNDSPTPSVRGVRPSSAPPSQEIAVAAPVAVDAAIVVPRGGAAATAGPFTPTPGQTTPIPTAAPAAATQVATPSPTASAQPDAPVAVAQPKPAFIREVAGTPRQTVALRPQADTPAPPVAGTRASAAQVFGAAIQAANDLDERRRGPALPQAATSQPAATLAAAGPTAVAPPAQAPLDMRRGDWPNTMIDRIERLRDAADANDTRIRLVPDALGAIDVSVKTVGDALHVRFAAEDATTRALIQDAQPRLAALAEERGIRLGQTLIEAPAAAQNAANQNAQSGQQPPAQNGSSQSQTASTPTQAQSGQFQSGQSHSGQSADAQGNQQSPRQQSADPARRPTASARSPRDADAAGDGRIA